MRVSFAKTVRELKQPFMYDVQHRVAKWVISTFGLDIFLSPKERVLRVLEEAMELAQSEGIAEDQVNRLAARVWSRPVGDAMAEAGGVALSLCAYVEMKRACLPELVLIELERIDKPEMIDKCRRKFHEKRQAGVNGDTP